MKEFANVHEELEYIAIKNNGICSPHDVVKFAQDSKTNLHSCFVWDDKKAAYNFRLEQARRLIRLEMTVIEVENKLTGNVEFVVRKYHSLSNDKKKISYRLITDILSNFELRKQLVKDALDEFLRLKEKYSNLHELSKIYDNIEEVKKDLL